MRVLFVSSEVFPLAKTGGLADVSAALPAALSKLGIDVRIMMPAYPSALAATAGRRRAVEQPRLSSFGRTRLIAARMPDSGLPLLLLDCPELFDRPGGPYLDPEGREWRDNARRFALLNRAGAAVAEGIAGLDWQPDIVHANDWHTGPLAAMLAVMAGPRPGSLFVVHNMAFQGLFPAESFDLLGLPPALFGPRGIEYYGKVSYLKAGLRYADRIVTVSPTYAKEILTPELGCGLEGVLRSRPDLTGILNGVDRRVWDPARDPYLACSYGAADLSGKRFCKTALQRELGLDREPGTPLIAFISRMTEQKMADIVAASLGDIVARGAQIAVIGDGDRAIEQALVAAARGYSRRSAVRVGYEEGLAHRAFAGADLILAPARFEPCGLTPIYAMLYGSVPLVRRVGGMTDAVIPASDQTMKDGVATGFAFGEPTREAMLAGLEAALGLYRNEVGWRELQLNAMRRDAGWEAPARRYIGIYREIAQAFALGVQGAPGAPPTGSHRTAA